MVALVCQECRVASNSRATGWRGYRIDDPDENGPPALAFYCPTCAEREFGPSGYAAKNRHPAESGE